MSQPAENPCSDVEECKQVVVLIVQEIYKMPQRMFTIEVLTSYETNLCGVTLTLLNTAEDCIPSKFEVLDNINQARGELGLAIERLVNKSADREFNRCLRNCRLRLEDALEIWSG